MNPFRDGLTRAAMEDPDEGEPWLVCSDVEFEEYVNFLRRPESLMVEITRKDGVDIEDVIFALRVKRAMVQNKGTRH